MLKIRRITIVVDQPLGVVPRLWRAWIKSTKVFETGETRDEALLNLFQRHGRRFGVGAIHWHEGFYEMEAHPSPRLIKSIKEGLKDYKEGKTYSFNNNEEALKFLDTL